MRFELQFNEAIYRKQMKLLYDIGYGKKKNYYKYSNYLGFGFVIIGFLTIVSQFHEGYLFIIVGIYLLISYYHFSFKDKRILQKYEFEQLEVIDVLRNNPNVIFEFNGEGLIYSDYSGELLIKWDEFLNYIEEDENIFLIKKGFQPFCIGKSEIGKDNYYLTLDFIDRNVKKL
ncbi:hypothetical protein FLAN108750_06970 [Flavobacterium antarcticum]|uniref:hypothetical protein n=1 Tax=Flavobacterium antarcticum TaxID=271155 RepID=UPI0003B70161|nr:hypothetical protein [Flavobacterium antarcticum]